MDFLLLKFQTELFPQSVNFFTLTWPFFLLILPIILTIVVWQMRVYYVRRVFDKKIKYVLLEIKVPREVTKSPAAMELFLLALYQTSGESNAYHTNWLGKARAQSSLEIVSIEGQIHFYVRVRDGLRNQIEAAMYAQYPEVEIYPSDDYTKNVYFDKSDYAFLGTEFVLAKDSAYPIKTYVDYGMDKNPDEEFKIDPLSPLIEFFGHIGNGEQLWLQYVIRAYKPKPTDPWGDNAKKIVNETLNRDPKTKQLIKPEGTFPMFQISEVERDILTVIQRAQNKLAFEIGIRAFYLAKKDKFNGINISGILGVFKQFNANNFNGFKPKNVTTFDDWPWQDYKETRTKWAKRSMLHAYKLRCFFNPPYTRPFSIMNSEALATIFHIPSSVVSTPTFERITSKKSEPPANLPIG